MFNDDKTLNVEKALAYAKPMLDEVIEQNENTEAMVFIENENTGFKVFAHRALCPITKEWKDSIVNHIGHDQYTESNDIWCSEYGYVLDLYYQHGPIFEVCRCYGEIPKEFGDPLDAQVKDFIHYASSKEWSFHWWSRYGNIVDESLGIRINLYGKV